MRKDNLKKTLLVKLQIFFAALVLGFMLADGVPAYAAEEDLPQPAEEECHTQYDDAVKLAEMLRQSPYLLYNKTYTAEQEGELQAVVDSVCGGESTGRGKAEVLLAYIRETLEPGESCELNGWDTLCDGDVEVTLDGVFGEADKTILKKQASQQTWCFTFYDVCRLADIPCFILEDCRVINGQELYNKYICMVYIEKTSGTGKEWHFVNVMAEDGEFVTAEKAYEVMGDEIFPMNICLDYNKMMMAMNVIFLNQKTMLSYSRKAGAVPCLAYDGDTNTVKTYFQNGTLANEEEYCRTAAKVGEDGEAPSGWIESRIYSGGKVTTYLLYSMHGVFLRGRVDKAGTEYDLQGDYYSRIPYSVEMGSEDESEEHKEYRLGYKQKLENEAIEVAKALLKDENYIWDDVNFTEEDEALIKEAVETALDWDYITGNEWSVQAFENAGILLEDENPEALSDKAKAQAILYYIRRNVEPVDHAPLNVDSPWVLRNGVAVCAGMTLLYRDMCVMAGLPCFMLICDGEMDIEDSLLADHANNLVKTGDEWVFVDPMNTGVIGKGTGYQTAIYQGYSTYGTSYVFLDCEVRRKDCYNKWYGFFVEADYYDFDSEGNLGIYHRNRFGEPVVIQDKTDENGKYLLENGLHTIDVKERTEDGKAEVVNRYAYYYQNLWMLQGEKVIDGKAYHFGEDANYSYYHKVEEVSRRYIIGYLDFQPIEDQPYQEDGVCPIPEIYHGDKKLELGKDFKITEYTHNEEVTSYVDAGYQVEGIGDYTGSAIRYFKIVQADISELDAELSETSYVWTPTTNYYKPEVKLDLNWQDYDVAYYDYNTPGTAKVVITGKRNYKGSITKYYNIAQRVWNEEDFQIMDMYGRPLQSQELSYNFYSVKPEAKVYWFDEEGNGYALSVSDYDISYSNFDEPGIATVTATAKGNYYRGSVSCTYKIKQYDIGDNSGVKQLMSMSHSPTQKLPKVYYTGSPVMPIIPDFNNLEKDVHYTMTVTDNVNVGIAEITLQGIGVCTGTYVKEFEVVPCVLSENAISVEYRYTTYNGQVQKPSVTIKTDLVEGRDYFITYEKEVDGEYQETEPKEVGEYWVAVHVTDNVLIRQAGVSSDADAPDCYYISYSINGDASGNGTGDSGSGSGNSGTGSGTGDSGSGSGSSD
ncbi:MAG: transglutaminase-like domain-containing protein, partial [Eubacteriales bacterium]|nr:transglutaminase-like domain-containing protein [Eubacteriales bacterium]